MDLLLSLPVLSYFSSSWTTWSTSLNLLFFYMTWSTLVLSHSPLEVELVGITALRVVFWLVPSLLFLAFDTLLPSLAKTVKFNGTSALPPRDAKTLAKVASLALLNLALETAIEAAISYGLSILLDRPIFRTSTTLPLPWQIAKHLAMLFAGREILTYYIHRHLLHGRRRHTTKTKTPRALHGSHAHARPAPPYSLLVRADHPLPYLLYRFAPLYLPGLALALASPLGGGGGGGGGGHLHLLTFFLFVALATLEETLALSGYAVVPGIVAGGMARRAVAHYTTARSNGTATGNFGTWGVLDWMHGTSVGGGDVAADLKDEARKHRVRERGQDKAGVFGGFVRDGVDRLRDGKRRSGRTKSRGTKRE
ncbi:hypothetical protein VTH82DRAFT_4885 [Thermothelomyces myriococcoides]